METLGIYALVAGFVLLLAGTWWMLVAQVHSGFLWGLVFVSVPLVGFLLWLPWHWREGRGAFLTQLLGAILVLSGLVAFEPGLLRPVLEMAGR
jgi:hypothetical protein